MHSCLSPTTLIPRWRCSSSRLWSVAFVATFCSSLLFTLISAQSAGTIVNQKSKTCVAVSTFNGDSPGRIVPFTCNPESKAQLWTFQPVRTGGGGGRNSAGTDKDDEHQLYQIFAGHLPNMCLGVLNGTKKNRAPIVQVNCDSSDPAQLFQAKKVGDGDLFHLIPSSSNGKCLRIKRRVTRKDKRARLRVEQASCASKNRSLLWDIRAELIVPPPTNEGGSGQETFRKNITRNELVNVGTVPAGISDLKIILESDGNVDLQLFDNSNGVAIVRRKRASTGKQRSIEYEDMDITYSGHDGFDGRIGAEYITIQGVTTKELAIKAFGYGGGVGSSIIVHYAWGRNTDIRLEMDYTTEVDHPTIFDALSERDTKPGAIGIRVVKFVINGIDKPNTAEMYFMNTKVHDLHYKFVKDALGWTQSEQLYAAQTYWSANRINVAGYLLYHPNYVNADGTLGIYTVEFFPSDPVQTVFLLRTSQILNARMPYAKIFYHPVGETQQRAYETDVEAFERGGIAVISTQELFGNVVFSGLNPGRSLGILRVVGPSDDAPSIRDVAIFTFVPPDLNHVAGIITEAPQTPLSHINLKAKQNKTPNAYIKDASQDPNIAPLVGQIVAFEVNYDGYKITTATQAEADAWLESVRPKESQIPESDLTALVPRPLSRIRHKDWIRYGAKAANVAELNFLFDQDPVIHTPDGYAVPFAMYDKFMSAPRCGDDFQQLCTPSDVALSSPSKTLYEQAKEMMAVPQFEEDAEFRKVSLETFREQIEDSEASAEETQVLEAIRVFWDPQGQPYETNLRCRSSTNNEDLEGFNGAGLYESKTHKPDEGDLVNTVKEIWASLWTMRAFDERTFYRIDHFKTYMGVLLHPSYGDEQANGVGVTKNIYANFDGVYINAQYGEISVTNPEEEDIPPGATHAIPDEIVVSRMYDTTQYYWETQQLRYSNIEMIYDNQPVPTENVLTPTEIEQLRIAMLQLQEHFKVIYNGGDSFAMDIEFKVMRTTDYDPDIGIQPARGQLSIKQARPWVDYGDAQFLC